MINYNDDNAIPEKVKISDIKAFNKTAKIHALQTLVNYCKELDQRLVSKTDFINARDAVECNICHKNVITKASLNKNGNCASCQRQVDKEKKWKEAEAKLLKNWKQLEKDLIKFSPDYVLLSNNKIKRTVSLRNNKDFVEFAIYREVLLGGSKWHRNIAGHALRIESNKYGMEATRLKKDFSSKNVAKSLHGKIEKIVKEHEATSQRKKSSKETETKFIKAIMKKLNIDSSAIKDNYLYPQGCHKPGRASLTTKKIQFGNLNLLVSYSITNPDKFTYQIREISNSLTLEQVKKISKIAK